MLPAQVTVGDPTAARLVLLIVITLVVVGFALIAVAVWLIRSTRVDPPEVAVLELMTTHAYLAADTEERERMIERVLAEIAEAEATAAARGRDDAGDDARVDNDVPPDSSAMEATTNSSDGGEPADSVR
ncbi:MAG: hypothetical protein ISQ15_06755 [Ilumatobacteraceae bacterium]|nr:hypothetical protein [Ilumatobacteraceae bacterium]